MKERVNRQTIAPRLFSKPKDVIFLLGLLVVGCADFFKLIFSKKSSETQCQTVLIQIRTDVLLVLISGLPLNIVFKIPSADFSLAFPDFRPFSRRFCKVKGQF